MRAETYVTDPSQYKRPAARGSPGLLSLLGV